MNREILQKNRVRAGDLNIRMLTIVGPAYIIDSTQIREEERMNLGTYGILIVFGAFILLLIFSPNLSCFGKKVRSPLNPIFRRKKRPQKRIVTEDYGFELVDEEGSRVPRRGIDDFERVEIDTSSPEALKRKKIIAKEYGFSLDDDVEAEKTKMDS